MLDAQNWLSPPRLDVYLTRADNDLQMALDLYLWKSTLDAAAMSEACHLEIVLRNAYNVHLARGYPNWAVDTSGSLSPAPKACSAPPLNRQS